MKKYLANLHQGWTHFVQAWFCLAFALWHALAGNWADAWPQLKQSGWHCLVLLDRLGNAFTGGDPAETISSRLGKHLDDRRCSTCRWLSRGICWFLRLITRTDHCRESVNGGVGGNAAF